jgi:hypothetical protein
MNRLEDKLLENIRMQAKLLVFITLVFVLYGGNSIHAQVLTSVKIKGGTAEFREKVEKNLTTFFQSLAKKEKIPGSILGDQGKKNLDELMKVNQFACIEPELNLNLSQLAGGDFEVRSIPVKMDGAEATEELVLNIDKKAQIIAARFAMEEQNMMDVLNADDIDDYERRQVILQFLELYRTAYNRKDADYIEGTFSEGAVIIVGQVLKPKTGDQISLEKSSISRDNINFIRYSKQEYIKRLRDVVFKNSKYIAVSFSEVEIKQHPKIKEIYGVSLKQRWNSGSYSDEGYIFLMIDFKNPAEPVIHVRSWQPEKFQDGSIVNLYDFPVID